MKKRKEKKRKKAMNRFVWQVLFCFRFCFSFFPATVGFQSFFFSVFPIFSYVACLWLYMGKSFSYECLAGCLVRILSHHLFVFFGWRLRYGYDTRLPPIFKSQVDCVCMYVWCVCGWWLWSREMKWNEFSGGMQKHKNKKRCLNSDLVEGGGEKTESLNCRICVCGC